MLLNANYKLNTDSSGLFAAYMPQRAVSFSSNASAQEQPFEKVGADCVDYISKLGIKSSNKDVSPEDWQYLHYNPLHQQIGHMRDAIENDFYHKGKSFSEYNDRVCKDVEERKIGNCSEQAALAAKYIKLKYPDIKLNLVSYMGKVQSAWDDSMGLLRDHCNIIMGLPEGFDFSKLNDKKTVDSLKNAYMVDAWGGFHTSLKEGIDRVKEMLKLRECDTISYSSFVDEACKRKELKKDINLFC